MVNYCQLLLLFVSSLLFALPHPLLANTVVSFTLINAESNSDISVIEDGDTINLANLPSPDINIRVNTDPSVVDSVAVSLSGATTVSKIENAAPYALWGDQNGNYTPGALNTGRHILTALPTFGGIQGSAKTASFNVVATNSVGPTADSGKDRYIFLPANDVILTGTGTDGDGTIVQYSWIQLEGPATAVLEGENTQKLKVSSLVEGIYLMQLTVTDNDGNSAQDSTILHVFDPSTSPNGPAPSGELKKWHKVTLTFSGPATSETATPNPFTDYRLNVTFVNDSIAYTVPGYFAADGNAANSGAVSGNKWRAHFAPDKIGTWHYVVSFRSGTNIIETNDPMAGSADSILDGMIGSFNISATDKTGRDHRGKGRLQYIGKHYLRFAETGEYFLKQGADAPENFLAYDDFDNTPDNGGRRKSWSAHIADWNTGDPTWLDGKGKGIIGAINYLASEGMNAFSFIPMNIGGDDKNVFPYISDTASDRTRLDCSKLDQWEIVFEHADTIGMFLHFKTQETENELLLDNGDMGIQRKVYYRELIARFGHHLALNWNLGEEINNASTTQKKDWAQFFYGNDPYHHHIVIHNMGNPHYDLLGPGSRLTGFSLQTSQSDFSLVHSRVKDYITRSADSGKPWAVACDEPGDASHALRPDYDAGNSHEDGRKNGLWGTLMAGGYGNEWYFGYQHDHSDLTCQDFRSRDNWWDYCRIALNFFTQNNLPFWQMSNNNEITSADNDYCFYKPGSVYVVYLKNGGTTDLDLRGFPGPFEVKWYDPRNGGHLQSGSVAEVDGGSWVNLGSPPDPTSEDWTILIRKPEARNTFWLLMLPAIQTGNM